MNKKDTVILAMRSAMRSAYSLRLYEVLRNEKYLCSKVYFDLEDFKQDFQIDKIPCFYQYSNIKAQILLPAIKEINEVSDLLVISFEENATEQKVLGFTLIFHYKKTVAEYLEKVERERIELEKSAFAEIELETACKEVEISENLEYRFLIPQNRKKKSSSLLRAPALITNTLQIGSSKKKKKSKNWRGGMKEKELEELEARWVFHASKKIYEELKKVYGELKKELPRHPEVYFDLEAFKRFLQLPPTFQKYENIRRYILHPAIRVINRDTDLDLWVNDWIREKKKKKQAPRPVIGFFLNFNLKPSQKKKIQK